MMISMTRTPAVRHAFLPALVLIPLALGGCASFSKDGGFDAVAKETDARLHQDVRWARTPQEQRKNEDQVAGLLAHSLSAEDAVQIALLNNRSLQASFEQL